MGCELPTSTNDLPPIVTYEKEIIENLTIGSPYGGGIVFFIDTKGFFVKIAAKNDLKRTNLTGAIATCKDKWRIPTIQEAQLLKENKKTIGGFVDSTYWDDIYFSCTIPRSGANPDLFIEVISLYHSYPGIVVAFKDQEHNCRLVKTVFLAGIHGMYDAR